MIVTSGLFSIPSNRVGIYIAKTCSGLVMMVWVLSICESGIDILSILIES